MLKPFELPDGLAWTDPTEDQIRYAARRGISRDNVATLSITITLRRASDGVERTYTDHWYPFDPAREGRDEMLRGMHYQWLDGNFGCGCNRKVFFARAGDEDDPEDPSCDNAGDERIAIVAPGWLTDER